MASSILRPLVPRSSFLVPRGVGAGLAPGTDLLAAGGVGPAQLSEARHTLQAHQHTLTELFEARAWDSAFDLLIPFSHWVTPADLPLRFDTWFFLLTMPADQDAQPCHLETTEGLWIEPSAALAGAAQERYTVIYPTAMHLRRLAEIGSLSALEGFAKRKPIQRICMEKAYGWLDPVEGHGAIAW